MKLGWKELRAEFEGVKWYDRKTIRDESLLAPEEIKYIKSWTISPLGFGNIFYIFKRVLPEIATIYVITYLYLEAYEPFISPLLNYEKFGLSLALLIALLSFVVIILSIYNTYFLFRHGRRLSWNRGRYVYSAPHKGKKEIWKSVQELRDSEKRYVKFNTIPSFVLLALLIVGMFLR